MDSTITIDNTPEIDSTTTIDSSSAMDSIPAADSTTPVQSAVQPKPDSGKKWFLIIFIGLIFVVGLLITAYYFSHDDRSMGDDVGDEVLETIVHNFLCILLMKSVT